jgi:hypothetical protein
MSYKIWRHAWRNFTAHWLRNTVLAYKSNWKIFWQKWPKFEKILCSHIIIFGVISLNMLKNVKYVTIFYYKSNWENIWQKLSKISRREYIFFNEFKYISKSSWRQNEFTPASILNMTKIFFCSSVTSLITSL